MQTRIPELEMVGGLSTNLAKTTLDVNFANFGQNYLRLDIMSRLERKA